MSCADAASGPLKPGGVGQVVKKDESRAPFPIFVAAEGQGWWYSAAVLRVVGQSCPQVQQSARAGPRGGVTIGDAVMLSPTYEKCGDASDGPLRPGDVGQVLVDDESDMALLVLAGGRQWWYNREALVALGQTSSRGAVGSPPVYCPAQHNLVPFAKGPGEGSNICDQCGKLLDNGDQMHHCSLCDYDLCPDCYRRAAAGKEVGSRLSAAMALPGVRVCRGPDWNRDDQDGGGEGVLVGLDSDGWAKVKWEKAGTNKYRVGQSGKYDLVLAQRFFGDQDCSEALLQRMFDATKKQKSTMDRSGAVPNAFVVLRVDQVQNPSWHESYMTSKRQMLRLRGQGLGSSPSSSVLTKTVADQLITNAGKDALSTDAEAVLLHGTSPSSVAGIVSSRFDPDRCKFGLAGKGFYFAESVTKADEYATPSNGVCCIMVCRVLLGRVNVCGDSGVTRKQRQDLEDSVRKEGAYDSVMMDRERCRDTFREFVVYDTTQCLPLFVVWYKRRTG
mmetsp:Transcript_98151/g.262137  ORF Transcript_98151/g.262137 Transcript_98151/m.262137 type:complete len:502 (-) Transcript_98151:231-1736(-)